jgi:hypothetical protein
MPQAVSGPAAPPTCLRGAAIAPGCRTLPPLRRRMVQVDKPSSVARAARRKQPPPSPGTRTAPDHLGRVPEALAQRCKPQTLRERIASPHDRPPPARMQSGHDRAGPCAGGGPSGPIRPRSPHARPLCPGVALPQGATGPAPHQPPSARPPPPTAPAVAPRGAGVPGLRRGAAPWRAALPLGPTPPRPGP